MKAISRIIYHLKNDGVSKTLLLIWNVLSLPVRKRISRLKQSIADSALFWYRHPDIIVMEITTGCNLKCETCRIAAQKVVNPSDADIQFVDYELFSQMLKRLSPFIKKAGQINFSSSEPLFHNRIFDMIDLVKKYKKNIVIKIITNGMLLNETRIKQLLKREITDICVSIDGCKKETVEAIRKGANFDQLISNIKKLKEIGGDTVHLRTIFVAQKRNVGELLDFVDLCNDLDIRDIKVSGIISYLPENVIHCLYSEAGMEKVDEIFHQAKQKANNLGIKFSYETTKVTPGRCSLAKTMYIDEKGDVSPCVFLAEKTPLTLLNKTGITEPVIWGNVFQEDPRKIWRSKASVNFRNILHQGKIPEECTLCAFCYTVIC